MSMKIKPTSPEQTREFLNENEEILSIGYAKEKSNIIERQRWIALTDQGRFLIFQQKEVSLINKSITLGRSFRGSFSSKEGGKATSNNELNSTTPYKDDEGSLQVSNLSSGYKQKNSQILTAKESGNSPLASKSSLRGSQQGLSKMKGNKTTPATKNEIKNDLPLSLELLESILIDINTDIIVRDAVLSITRRDVSYRFVDVPTAEWFERLQMMKNLNF